MAISNPRRHRHPIRHVVFVLTGLTVLAIVTAAAMIASYVGSPTFDLTDREKNWCVLALSRSRCRLTYSSGPQPPDIALYETVMGYKYAQIRIATYNLMGALHLLEKQREGNSSPILERHFRELTLEIAELKELEGVYAVGVLDDLNWWARMESDPLQFAVQIHLGIPFVLFAAYPVLRLVRFIQHRRRTNRAGKCSHCGYDLTGNTSGVCPECGTSINKC